MWKTFVERRTRRTYASFGQGDAEPAIDRLDRDASFRIGGDGPFQAELHGREEIARWLRSLMLHRLRWDIEDILVNGNPRNTRLMTRYVVRSTEPSETAWNYRGVQYAHLRWGRITLDDILTASLSAAADSDPAPRAGSGGAS